MTTLRTTARSRGRAERRASGAVRSAFRAAALVSLFAAVASAGTPPPSAKDAAIPVPDRGALYVRYGKPGGVMIHSIRRPATPPPPPASAAMDRAALGRIIAEELARARREAQVDISASAPTRPLASGAPESSPVVVTRPRGHVFTDRSMPGSFPVPGGPDLADLTPEQAAVELFESGVLRTTRIHFAFNRADLLPESAPAIATVAQVLRDNPEWRIRVEGHADKRGGECYNLTLSRRRAEAVRNYLVKNDGIAEDRLTAIGFGEMLPLSDEETEEAYAANRRVEFRLMD